MEYISENDNYEIRLASLVSNVDKDVVIELYQPLIGSTATMLYLTLLKQKRNDEDESFYLHIDLMNILQIQPGVLLTSRHSLEAVGLLKTYEKKNSVLNSYIYVLYAPKTPKEFFEDVLFKGLLVKTIGEKNAMRLASHYHVDNKIPSSFKDVSSSFIDFFNLDYDDESFKTNFGENIIGHEVGRVIIKFSYDLFFKHIENNSQLSRALFSKEDVQEIERIATLFSLNEETMAAIIIHIYNPYSKKHIDFTLLKQKAEEKLRYPLLQQKRTSKSNISSKSRIAEKIKLMENKSPVEFLTLLQGNTKPASSDINIANMLSQNYGFSNGVINAIIDYTLEKNDNVLSKNYCEKIASSLKREQIENTIDAMNYLNKYNSKTKQKTANKEATKVDEKNNEKNDVTSISDDELNDLLSDIKSLKK